jgi:hypothetical protein
MWLLHLMPDWLLMFAVYAALGIGVALTIAGWIMKNIIAQIGGVALLVTGVYWYGGYTTEMIWREQVAALEEKIKESENRAPVITKEIVTKYKDKIFVVNRGVEVIKKEIEIKREIINEGCKLNPTAVEMYNKGISGGATVEVGPLTPEEKR